MDFFPGYCVAMRDDVETNYMTFKRFGIDLFNKVCLMIGDNGDKALVFF